MNNYPNILTQLKSDLYILDQRRAKYGVNIPLDLLHQIRDHEQAIALTEQCIAGELTEAEWREALRPLNIDHTLIEDSFFQKALKALSLPTNQQRELRNRQIMIQRVHDFWIKGVLENSLHNEVLIELQMETKPEAVESPWDVIIRPDQPNRILPAGTKMIDVFDESGGSLLILGEPGSGKTTMLLELARQLIARAQLNPAQPMPVVFNLASWAEKRLPLTEWLVEELNNKYYIPKNIAQSWIENDELLLLLDGLDEVTLEYQADCTKVINNFKKTLLTPLVVCSRTTKYKDLPSRLSLNKAINLRPLTYDQIKQNLGEGAEFLVLRQILDRDEEFQELLKSPLMLSIAIFACRESSNGDLQSLNSNEFRKKQLFTIYVEKSLNRRKTGKIYSLDIVNRWLKVIANKLYQNDQTILLVERIQPTWLSPGFEVWSYYVIFSLIATIFLGVIYQLSFSYILGNVYPLILVPLGLLLLLLYRMGLVYKEDSSSLDNLEVFIQDLRKWWTSIELFEIQHWSWKRASEGLLFGLGTGILFSCCALTELRGSFIVNQGLDLREGTLYYIGAFLRSGIILGIILGSIFGATGGAGITENRKFTSNQAILHSVISSITVWFISVMSIVIGLSILEISGLGFGIDFGSRIGIAMFVGPLAALYYGGLAIIQHYTLCLVLFWNNYLPLHLVPFLDYCVDRIFLRNVGGGYIFIHRYLMEYFASLTEEDIERLSAKF